MTPDPLDPHKTLTLQLAEQRRLSTDQMMWQVPSLSLAAQSFLLTIVLSGSATAVGRAIAAFVACALAYGALRTMLKHRYHEQLLSMWLEQQQQPALKPLHHLNTLEDDITSDRRSELNKGFLSPRWRGKRLPAYKVWAWLLTGLIILDVGLGVLSVLGYSDWWATTPALSEPTDALRPAPTK